MRNEAKRGETRRSERKRAHESSNDHNFVERANCNQAWLAIGNKQSTKLHKAPTKDYGEASV